MWDIWNLQHLSGTENKVGHTETTKNRPRKVVAAASIDMGQSAAHGVMVAVVEQL